MNFRRFKEVETCFVIEVCEGEGTSECPVEAVFYVIDMKGRHIGSFTKRPYKENFNDFNPENPTNQ